MVMKKIEVIIPPKKFIELEEKLRDHGVHGITVTDLKGYGNQQTRPENYLLLPKTKVEIYAVDSDLEMLISVIMKICQTGQLGDGKIAIYDVQDIIRIRTGERGNSAV